QITTQFSGISDTSSDPPHNALAVGPSYIVMAEGSRIEWTNLSGGAANLQSVYQFFGSLGSTAANALFDPRAVYDSVNNRYVVTMDNIGSNGAISNIDIAVSKDSNPNDGWYFYSLNTSLTINGQLTAADQPILSLDGTNIYITAPQYDVNVSGFAGTEEWVISDTAGTGGGLYNGGTMTVVASQLA
ncbi:phosphoesterase, partial [Mesorhizobium sp. VK2B]|nr:phosphoesterase [Mesorhizobium sp. VK2B]